MLESSNSWSMREARVEPRGRGTSIFDMYLNREGCSVRGVVLNNLLKYWVAAKHRS